MSANRHVQYAFFAICALGPVWAQTDDLPPVYFGFGTKCALDSAGVENGYCDFFGDNQPLYHKYRLVLLDGQDCYLSAWPVHIVGKDTSYSASDGGFFSGPCQYRKTTDSLTIKGKYTVISYSRMADSSYSFGFAIRYDRLHAGANRMNLKKWRPEKNVHRR